MSTHLSYTSNVLFNNWYQSIIGFSSFDALTIHCAPIGSIKVDLLVFEPKSSHNLLLPNRLEITHMIKAFEFRRQTPIVMMRRLKGLTLANSKTETTYWTILLESINFDFYLNETTLVTAQYCGRQHFPTGGFMNFCVLAYEFVHEPRVSLRVYGEQSARAHLEQPHIQESPHIHAYKRHGGEQLRV